MAEIKIEKKKPVWPWILLVLGLLVAAWFLFLRNDKDDRVERADDTSMIDVHENNSTVAAYIAFIKANNDDMSLDHTYTSEALTKLTNAVDAMADEVDYDVKVNTTKAKQYANEITNDPMSTTHADKIRSAADLLSTALHDLQQARYPELSADAANVKSAAAAISPESLTLDQQNAVKSFFRKSADLLSKMN